MKCPVKNPFSYADTKTMLVWKVAQCCVWMINALWRDPSDSILITNELQQMQNAVDDLNEYFTANR